MTPVPGESAVAGHAGEASVTPIGTSRTTAWEGLERAIAADHPSARASRPSGPVSLLAGMPLEEIAERTGLRRIDVLAWRDFDDPEAGGSELHAHRVITAWSAAGLDVSMTTSSVPGGRRVVRRDGYRVIRRAGRYSVFPRSILSGAVGRIGTGDGVVEIWNGMPFFKPGLVAQPRRSPSSTTSTPRCGSWCCPRVSPRSGHLLSSTGSPRPSTDGPDRDPVVFLQGSRSWTACTSLRTTSR